MDRKKRQAWLEIVFEILQRMHGNLCVERKLKEAEELQDIIRRLILFSEKV